MEKREEIWVMRDGSKHTMIVTDSGTKSWSLPDYFPEDVVEVISDERGPSRDKSERNGNM